MCGIAGIIDTRGRPIDQNDLERLIIALRHRGPDGAKSWRTPDRSCGLVHLRLAILDTAERADQPMVSHDGRYTIVYNGEIFNFLELRDELEGYGARFRTESDTEVILEAWRRWGTDMLPRLNGMWAMAIRDNLSGDAFLARDRFGIKPLVYYHQEGRFAFASEIRGLRALPFVDDIPDERTAARLLFEPMGVEASDRTLHRMIHRLPAGHMATLCGDRLAVRRWWHTLDNLIDPPATLQAAGERFRELFFDSIKLRMRSDVRIGTCLSGGFDSTAVVSSMSRVAADAGMDHRRASDDWRYACIASFPGIAHDETRYAREAADFAGLTAIVEDLSGDEGPEDAEAVLSAMDDVYISLPTAIWKIYRRVAQLGMRVTLDGHGADELIGAYMAPQARMMFHLRNRFLNPAGASPISRRASETVKLAVLRSRGEAFLREHRVLPPHPLAIAALSDELPRSWGPLNRRLYGMFHGNILPTILRNFDRLSMAHGVEVRMPFMDWRLVVFAMSLPEYMKAAGGVTKLVAREGMRGVMPENIRSSPRKVGFNSQMPEWLNANLGRWAEDVVSNNPNGAFDSIVDRPALGRKLAALRGGSGWNWHNAGRLWPYINLKWYLDQPAVATQDRGVTMPRDAVAA